MKDSKKHRKAQRVIAARLKKHGAGQHWAEQLAQDVVLYLHQLGYKIKKRKYRKKKK